MSEKELEARRSKAVELVRHAHERARQNLFEVACMVDEFRLKQFAEEDAIKQSVSDLSYQRFEKGFGEVAEHVFSLARLEIARVDGTSPVVTVGTACSHHSHAAAMKVGYVLFDIVWRARYGVGPSVDTTFDADNPDLPDDIGEFLTKVSQSIDGGPLSDLCVFSMGEWKAPMELEYHQAIQLIESGEVDGALARLDAFPLCEEDDPNEEGYLHMRLVTEDSESKRQHYAERDGHDRIELRGVHARYLERILET
jgi:hypothetical protein